MSDPRIAPAETCVTRSALIRRDAEEPEAIFAAFDDGSSWTIAETHRRVRSAAAGLQSLGVGQGDRVLIMMPNSADGVLALFAVQYLGAIAVPINTAYRGSLLQHIVIGSRAKLAIIHRQLLERLGEIDPAPIEVIVSPGETDVDPELAPRGTRLFGADVLSADATTLVPPARPIEPWDTQHIIWTSGTTGRSKGVLSSYMHCWSSVGPGSWTCLDRSDRQLLHMPIFHIGGAFIASAALCMGGSIGVVPAFRTETFWESAARMEVTSVFLLGAMATFLMKQPPAPSDRTHPLRHVMIVPLGQNGPPFRERFGVDVYTLFNMTEISTPLMSTANPAKSALCGRPRDGVSVRLVDTNDCEVARGEVGELVIRADAPWAMSHGYDGDAEATAAAWRNGWFHTGDMFRIDDDGDFFFVDRLKDAIRRRGENISSYEVEGEVLTHTAVREAAVVAVPSEHTEDEVLAVVALVPGMTLDAADLINHLVARLPHFMVPRYVRIVDELPKTPTAKVEKHLLRSHGLTPDTWDREAAGIRLRAQKLD